jgi:hypothetical protein
MKKLVLSLVALVAFASVSFAQLSGGIRAGLNLANQKYSVGSDSESGDMKAGFLLGLYLTGNLSENLAIQPELVYSGFGTKEDDESLNLGYLSIPVLLRYNINEMINVHLGPQFGILMSAKAEDEDVKDAYKGADMGLTVGVGLDFGAFNAGARYYAGLSNIVEENDLIDLEGKNSAIQIVLGYRLFGGD